MRYGGLTEDQIAERVVDYDEDSYGFVRMVRLALLESGVLNEETPLGKLHALRPPKGRRKNPFLFVLQNDLRKSKDFAEALHRFVRREVCAALRVSRVAYQRRPTFRVHMAGGPAQGFAHADGLEPYNHQPGEVNIWAPLSKVYGSNSLTSESSPGKGDFHAFKAGAGQFVRFYGNRCWHYCLDNTTEDTRVSFDLRVVPMDLFDDNHDGPIRTLGRRADKRRFSKIQPLKLGEYYMDSDAEFDEQWKQMRGRM